MLVIEQLILPHSPTTHTDLPLQNIKGSTSTIEFDADAELVDQEHDGGLRTGRLQSDISESTRSAPQDGADAATVARPLTFGLVVHGLADGLALGVSSIPTDAVGSGSRLSFIVFLALLIHKGQTVFLRMVCRLICQILRNSPYIIRTNYIPACHFSSSCKVQKTSGSLQRLNPSWCHRILPVILILWKR
jgi:hypothetical protein